MKWNKKCIFQRQKEEAYEKEFCIIYIKNVVKAKEKEKDSHINNKSELKEDNKSLFHRNGRDLNSSCREDIPIKMLRNIFNISITTNLLKLPRRRTYY